MLPGGASDIAHLEDIEQDDSDVSYTSDYSFYELVYTEAPTRGVVIKRRHC